MRNSLTVLVLLSATTCARLSAAQVSEERVAEVWSTEVAFAKTMADRDLGAFVSFLSDEAVFIGDAVLRGPDAIRDGWMSYFEGTDAPFTWEPEIVRVLDSGELAFSSGPVRARDGRRIGTFNSVWQRDRDGEWNVLFDKGCPPCSCGSDKGETGQQ